MRFDGYRAINTLLLLFPLLFFAASDASATILDNFNDGDDAGWVHVDLLAGTPFGPTNYDAGSGEYRISSSAPFPPLDAFVGTGAAWGPSFGDPSYSNGTLRTRITLANNATLGGVIMRFAPDASGGYIFWIDHEFDTMGITRFSYDGTAISIHALNQFTFDFDLAPDTYMLETTALGPNFSAKAWLASDPEPADPQVTASDNTLATGGLGVAVYNTAAGGDILDGRFDDITFVPEPASLLLFALATLGLRRR